MAEKSIRALLVDDHSMVRMGLVSLLSQAGSIKVVAEAEDAAEAIEQYRIHRPDVTLMDVKMPGDSGIDALRKIRSEFPDARIIILTTYDQESSIIAAMEASAAGYVMKSVKREELARVIRLVHGGGKSFTAAQLQRYADRQPREKLTPREMETLDCVRRGFSNREIAVALDVSESTVKAHMKAILLKLDVCHRAEAVAAGYQRGLFPEL